MIVSKYSGHDCLISLNTFSFQLKINFLLMCLKSKHLSFGVVFLWWLSSALVFDGEVIYLFFLTIDLCSKTQEVRVKLITVEMELFFFFFQTQTGIRYAFKFNVLVFVILALICQPCKNQQYITVCSCCSTSRCGLFFLFSLCQSSYYGLQFQYIDFKSFKKEL